MKMKKLMAVVLAVVIAISAMAVSVFAETYRLDLAKTSTYNNGKTITWTFDTNIYNLFGYADQDSYIEVKLPTSLTDTSWLNQNSNNKAPNINWYIEVNGVRTQLKSVDAYDATYDVGAKDVRYFTQYVNFGAFTRPYYYYNGDQWATIAQSQMVGDITSIRLIAEMTYSDNNDHSMATGQDWWQAGFKTDNYDMYVQLWDAGSNGIKDYNGEGGDDTLITGSQTPVAFMTVAKSENQLTATSDVSFLNSVYGENNQVTWNDAWTWDHTIQNRAAILGAESAKVIVVLKEPTNGVALYTLRTADQPTGSYDSSESVGNANPWPNYGTWANPSNVDIASTCIVNGQVTQLEFDLPMDYLYDTSYGVFNGGIWFTERQTLTQFETNWDGRQYYMGNPINYCHQATDVYIELTMPEVDDGDDTINVDDPIEPGDVETEPDTPSDIEVTDPVEDTTGDTNPSTGIVLAVIPMAIAAAAVVVSKRR